jgi:hypothetical protein
MAARTVPPSAIVDIILLNPCKHCDRTKTRSSVDLKYILSVELFYKQGFANEFNYVQFNGCKYCLKNGSFLQRLNKFFTNKDLFISHYTAFLEENHEVLAYKSFDIWYSRSVQSDLLPFLELLQELSTTTVDKKTMLINILKKYGFCCALQCDDIEIENQEKFRKIVESL